MSTRYASPFIYNGIRFRSRLEAQWACYFDALRIPFDYESHTFDLDGGLIYTPDFYLPTFDVFLEVKPNDPEVRTTERAKADALARHLEKGRVWLSHGTVPWFEQLPGPNVSAIPKAMLTHDAANAYNPTAIWITDARFITLNKPLRGSENLISPERISNLPTPRKTSPAHPLASPVLRTAMEVARNLKLSDRMIWDENPDIIPAAAGG